MQLLFSVHIAAASYMSQEGEVSPDTTAKLRSHACIAKFAIFIRFLPLLSFLFFSKKSETASALIDLGT